MQLLAAPVSTGYPRAGRQLLAHHPFPCAHTPSHRAGNAPPRVPLVQRDTETCETTSNSRPRGMPAEPHRQPPDLRCLRSGGPSQDDTEGHQRRRSQRSVPAHLPACPSASQTCVVPRRLLLKALNTSQMAARKIILKQALFNLPQTKLCLLLSTPLPFLLPSALQGHFACGAGTPRGKASRSLKSCFHPLRS